MSYSPLLPTPELDAATRAVRWAHIVYALHAFSLLTGILGPVTVISAFLTGWPSIIAVVLNYLKSGDAAGSWVDSHFRWQIRTFWFGLLWVVLCGLFVLATFGLGLFIVWVPLILLTAWFIYRIGRGWMALVDGRAVPLP
jgi:uncharacterized membrane protein